jgi:hypothetical protein
MRKLHVILLSTTVIMALSSAYSLAAINQVYKINFEWYSQYKGKFTGEYRETAKDKYIVNEHTCEVNCRIAGDENEALKLKKRLGNTGFNNLKADFNKYILLYSTFGEVDSPEYRIKIVDIAQRGDMVEVKVSINTPDNISTAKLNNENNRFRYYPEDIVRVRKASFVEKGKLLFIFKSQDGKKLYEERYAI